MYYMIKAYMYIKSYLFYKNSALIYLESILNRYINLLWKLHMCEYIHIMNLLLFLGVNSCVCVCFYSPKRLQQCFSRFTLLLSSGWWMIIVALQHEMKDANIVQVFVDIWWIQIMYCCWQTNNNSQLSV